MPQPAALKREVAAGVTTFFTMSYIVVVNPSILATEGTGIPYSGALTATVLVAFLSTLLMGLYAKLPFALAPGMGLNAFVAFTIILDKQVPWQQALGLVFLSGVVFLILSVTPVREWIARAIPTTLRAGAAAGIGLFLAFIGLKNAGMVKDHPATLVTFGPLDQKTLLFMGGLFLALFLLRKKSAFAFIAAIAAVSVAAVFLGEVKPPESLVATPDFTSVLFQLDVKGALTITLLPALVSLIFTDLFDSLSTFVGVSAASDLLDDDGEPKNLRQGLIVDAIATLSAGLFGSSPGTTYIESAAGIEAGGRTGWTAVTTAICFLPCLFLGPLLAFVPPYATAPVLVLVGAMMTRPLFQVDAGKLEELVPAVLTAILIPLTFSSWQRRLRSPSPAGAARCPRRSTRWRCCPRSCCGWSADEPGFALRSPAWRSQPWS
jgi:AGZA family xanthine/uracil permease-like MFS transporter